MMQLWLGMDIACPRRTRPVWAMSRAGSCGRVAVSAPVRLTSKRCGPAFLPAGRSRWCSSRLAMPECRWRRGFAATVPM